MLDYTRPADRDDVEMRDKLQRTPDPLMSILCQGNEHVLRIDNHQVGFISDQTYCMA